MTITDRAAQALAPGKMLSERMGGRGEGVLKLVGRAGGATGYFRYTDASGSRHSIPLGTLSATLPLKAMRDEARMLSIQLRATPDLKGWQEDQQAARLAERRARRQAEAEEAARGTLEDLLKDYVADMAANGRVSAPEVDKSLARAVYGSALGQIKARDITPSDIKDILTPLSKAGSMTQRNRVRSYLHAAFKFGLRAEYDETRVSGRRFGLTSNPVAATPQLPQGERVGTRALTPAQLATFFNELPNTPNCHKVLVSLFRFLIAIGGQRPKQVLAAPWTDYDLSARTLRIIDRKGRGSRARVHLLPLSDRALAELRIVQAINPSAGPDARGYPFIVRGTKPVSWESLPNIIKRFRGTSAGVSVPHFSPRDLRRTTKQIMTRAGVPRELRNLLQNHGQTGVDAKHYDNEPEAHLPSKRRALLAYDDALTRALEGRPLGADVVELDAYRRDAETSAG